MRVHPQLRRGVYQEHRESRWSRQPEVTARVGTGSRDRSFSSIQLHRRADHRPVWARGETVSTGQVGPAKTVPATNPTNLFGGTLRPGSGSVSVPHAAIATAASAKARAK